MTNEKDDPGSLKNGALYDDLGQLIQAPGGLPFVNERGNIEVRKPIDASRILERNAGCWNCIHMETGPVYDSVVAACYVRDIAVLKDTGVSAGEATKRATKTRTILVSRKGFLGICLTNKAEGDFVSSKYLCESWSGKQGASLARAPGEPLSPLVPEEMDKRGLSSGPDPIEPNDPSIIDK
jgi:hypothetical protein